MQLIEDWKTFFKQSQGSNWWKRKTFALKEREAFIVRVAGQGHMYHRWRYDDQESIHYLMHFNFFIKQGNGFYIEEHVQSFHYQLKNGICVAHEQLEMKPYVRSQVDERRQTNQREKSSGYDRRAAVQYADYWWNQYNPEFQQFTVDCTNFVSQCLLAGGAPMQGIPDRNQGWWYEGEQWSYSWSVAHSLRWYLSGATRGLIGIEVESASQLEPGDIICYDFEGDGRWDHNTIVTTKDQNGEPLVNAHTDNSRHRFWSYEDSTAWTPQMKYKFFQIDVTS